MSVSELIAGDDLIFASDGTVKAASFDKLVVALTDISTTPSFRHSFLLSYRSFTTPLMLLQALQDRFKKCEENSTTLLRIVGVMKAWLESHFYDFHGDKELSQLFLRFLEEISGKFKSAAEQLHKSFNRSLMKEQEKHTSSSSRRKNRVESFITFGSFFADLDPLTWSAEQVKEIAIQMSVLESKQYRLITPKECIAWNKGTREVDSPNISSLIRQFNQLSGWVVTEICKRVFLRDRAKILGLFIQLSGELFELNNLNGVMEILSGINSAAIRRLRQTFAALPRQRAEQFARLEEAMSHAHSFRNYRNHLHSINPPCVPYVGVYLTDLTFLEDGNPDTVDGLISWGKRAKIAEVIAEIQQYQGAYQFYENKAICLWLENLTTYTNEEAYVWSKRVEPKNYSDTLEEMFREEIRLRKTLNQLLNMKAERKLETKAQDTPVTMKRAKSKSTMAKPSSSVSPRGSSAPRSISTLVTMTPQRPQFSPPQQRTQLSSPIKPRRGILRSSTIVEPRSLPPPRTGTTTTLRPQPPIPAGFRPPAPSQQNQEGTSPTPPSVPSRPKQLTPVSPRTFSPSPPQRPSRPPKPKYPVARDGRALPPVPTQKNALVRAHIISAEGRLKALESNEKIGHLVQELQKYRQIIYEQETEQHNRLRETRIKISFLESRLQLSKIDLAS